MRKLFHFLIPLTLFINIIICEYPFPKFGPWECDNILYSCLKDEKCCKAKNSPDGYSCFKGLDSICCSDLGFACPPGTFCDFPYKVPTCRPYYLEFLINDSNFKIIESGTRPFLVSDISDGIIGSEKYEAIQLVIKGFFEGFPLLKNATHNSSCIDKIKFFSFLAEVLETFNILTALDAFIYIN